MYVDVVDVVDIDTNVLYVYRNVDIVDICRYSIEVDTISVSGYTVLSTDGASPPAISVPVTRLCAHIRRYPRHCLRPIIVPSSLLCVPGSRLSCLLCPALPC